MSGFTNILLDHESSLAITFHTPLGRYRWLRLPNGISSGPKEYQARQQEALEDWKASAILLMMFLFMVWANKRGGWESLSWESLQFSAVNAIRETQAEPYQMERDSKLRRWFSWDSSPQGVSPSPFTVEAILNMTKLSDPRAVQRYLGMLNFFA